MAWVNDANGYVVEITYRRDKTNSYIFIENNKYRVLPAVYRRVSGCKNDKELSERIEYLAYTILIQGLEESAKFFEQIQ